jgi:cell division protein FtsX
MDSFMESIFVLSGHVVSNVGAFIAILLIGLIPLYVFFFVCYKSKIAIKSALPMAYLFLASMLSLFLTAVFVMTAMALGAWG